MNYLFLNLGIAFILMHEMDAIRCKEWRIFPGLSVLKDEAGYWVFMLIHIPLLYFLFSGLIGRSEIEDLRWGLDIYFMIHMGLHLLFLMHPKNLFKDIISWGIIIGAAVCGLIDLWIGFL